MTHWIFSSQAATRLRDLKTGQTNLFDAALRHAQEVTTVSWDGTQFDPRGLERISGDEVVVYGGHPFLDALRAWRPDWASGIFHDPGALSAGRVIDALGPLALNHDAQAMLLEGARDRIASGETLFLRPDLGDKAFSGGTFGPEDLTDLPDTPDLAVIAAPIRDITAEFRFVIIDGEVATGSQYARDGKLDVRFDVDAACRARAREAALIYAPAAVYVCDVAMTREGPRVIEYNSFSSSGLYACDGVAIARGIEALVASRPAPSHTDTDRVPHQDMLP